jgi:3-oxoacyl-[acyl-carrier-protein] synthase-3
MAFTETSVFLPVEELVSPEVRIPVTTGLGIVRPLGRPVDNREIYLAAGYESPSAIQEKTGFRTRYQCGLSSPKAAGVVVDIGVNLGLDVMADKGWQPADVDILVANGTYTPQVFAEAIRRKLELPNAATLEVAAACASPLVTLGKLQRLQAEYGQLRVLVVAPELMSPHVQPCDKAMFSDVGAGLGFVLGKELRILSSVVKAAPEHGHFIRGRLPYALEEGERESNGLLWTQNYREDGLPHTITRAAFLATGPDEPTMVMDGGSVYMWSARNVPNLIKEAVAGAGLTLGDIDLIIPHQTNVNLAACFQRKLSKEVYWCGTHLGNGGAATTWAALLMALDEGRVGPGSRAVMVAYGAGMMAGASVIEIGE